MNNDEKIDILRQAIIEANRFKEAARKAIVRLEQGEYVSITGSKETAAAKRASMDLTRALVKVR